ncbi:MAG: hypothetical protein OEU54_05580 [Gemmatimonadota bacterium]|nr:hypothetical protein [Gemmatimonadota bacterium]
MTDHLHIERISALLDEPWSDLAAEQHLEACEECRTEFERLSRMRMAFSGLGELEPPRGEWERIQASLEEILGPDDSIVPITASPSWRRRLISSGPVQAAAALALFAGGIFAGLQFTGAGSSSPANVLAGGVIPAVIPATGADRELYDALNEFESMGTPLRQVGFDQPDGGTLDFDAFEAARYAATLEGIIQVLRERLQEAPGDPFASGYLPYALDQRQRLAELLEANGPGSSVVEW